MVERLILGYGAELHPCAHAHLLAADVPVTFLDLRGRPLGHLRGSTRHDPSPRIAQYRLYQNFAERLSQAAATIEQKLLNARQVLGAHKSNHPEFDWTFARQTTDHALSALPRATTLDQIRGHEGHAARAYWQIFPRMIRNPLFAFDGRNRRPPKDPTNALLSYVYVYLSNELSSILEAHGLDPYLGYLHEPRPGRPSLALDLLEPLRPSLADRFVLNSINRRRFSPEHFSSPGLQGAVYLAPEGKKTFFTAIEEWFAATEEQCGGTVQSPRSLLDKTVVAFKRETLDRHLRPEDLPESLPDTTPVLARNTPDGVGHGE